MYCSNCGKKVDEKAVVCVGCGVPLKNNQNIDKPKRGKGIASMVLGILAVFYCLSALTVIDNLDEHLYLKDSAFQSGFAFGAVLIQLVLAIVGICLSCAERRDNKNGFNTAGLWLTIIAIVVAALEFFYILTY